jgi:hypothetical protein
MLETQNYKNHVRWYPLVHFVLTPILFFNLIWQSVRLYQEPNWDRAENLLMAFAFIALSLAARLQALKAQDRVIRLEETLRYKELLPRDLAAKAAQLPAGKIVALRFASDGELPEMVARTLNNEFQNSKEIKLAIKNWRGDYLRV